MNDMTIETRYHGESTSPVPTRSVQDQIGEVLNHTNEVICKLRDENAFLKEQLDRINAMIAEFERSVL